MMRIKEVTRGELVEKYIVENVIANLKPGDKIPSERELASELGVAVHTVNKCLATLTERGVLCRRKGRGTFLAECSPRGKRVRILTRSMDYYERNAVTNWFNFQYVLEGFSIRAQELGMIPEIFLLNDLVPPTEETMEKLLEPDVSGYLFHIHRNQEVIRQWTTQLQENGKIVDYYEKLNDFERQVDGRFFRCHRSYLVNLDQVRGSHSGQVSLSDGSSIPVSRLRERELTEALLRYMKEKGC